MKIYYIIGALNDRIFRIYGYQFISIDDILDDLTRLKQSKRQSKSPLKDASQTKYNPQSYADKSRG